MPINIKCYSHFEQTIANSLSFPYAISVLYLLSAQQPLPILAITSKLKGVVFPCYSLGDSLIRYRYAETDIKRMNE